MSDATTMGVSPKGRIMVESPADEIIRRDLDTAVEDPAIQIAELVAEIEDTEMTELQSMYTCVDGVLDHLFSQPPAPEAQMQIEFSYETYRITIHQDGHTELVKTE